MIIHLDKMWTLFSIVLLSIIQMQQVMATGCSIVSVTSTSASTLNVIWSDDIGASVYLLDLRVVNSTSIAPVVVMPYPPSTQRLVQGLRPGHTYLVTLKVLEFYTVVCNDTYQAMTVPATSQITYSRAISSTSIIFEWSSVFGADSYILYVEELFSVPTKKYNRTSTNLSGQVDNLIPSTTYNCYVYADNNAGRSARSNIRTIITLVQPPTGVALVSTGRNTAQVSWVAVDKVLLYQVTVSDDDNPSNAPVIMNTSTTTMQISNLEPCSTYTVGVSSINVFLVPGEPSNVTHTTSTINPVTSITTVYSCSSGMVTVTWDLVFGANLYRATAVDGTGASLNCTSATNNCQITMLKCGEKYSVYVTAISDDCESIANTSTLFETVPCAPAHPLTSHDCSSDVIQFSWEATNNTLYYVAMAKDNNGQLTECRTQETTCFFTETGCGQFYTYTVLAVSTECNSEVSQPEFVRTSPCLPTNVKTAAQCHSENLITTWDSAAGALSYTIEAEGNTGQTYNCTSSSNSCAVTGVPCGEHLTVWIMASNDNCSTDRVLGEVAQTVPCTPTIVSASADCSQDSATVTWTTSIGALFYTAVIQDMNGNTHSCNSARTYCLVEDLTCGRNYTAHVIGTNLNCNSSDSDEIAFITAPCPPDNIEAFRDCDANHALIVWQNHQSTGNYTAIIKDQSGAQLSCNSDTVNNCKIPDLPCGKRYNVTVTNNDGNCSSTSTSISMDSVPCGPEDVEAAMNCLTNELTVTWSISVPADNYTTTISRGMGQPLYCNSTETQCTSGGLVCGSIYSVTTVAITGSCYSMPSTEVNVQSLPCPPTSVIAFEMCAPAPSFVTWLASNSANSYTAVAVSSTAETSVCTTNGTMCYFSDLTCGEVYSITVAGVYNNCTGLQGDAVPLYTEPCTPTNVSSQLDCAAATSHVFWNSDPNAVSYTVIAANPEQTLTCVSPTPNCTLTNLLCDHPYDIFVTATDGNCVSSNSTPIWQAPVPCAPVDVDTTLSCSTNDLTVSWTNSFWPLNYSVTATPLSGNMTSAVCSTDSTTCSLSSLHCGHTYNVSVKGCYGDCPGPYSVPQTIMTAPCAPQSLEAMIDCSTNFIWASWSASLGATSYSATMEGPNGFIEICLTSNLTCSFRNSSCGTQYSINVTAHDDYCTSDVVQTTMTTGPCDPVNVTAVLQCGSDAATVSWQASTGATAYYVSAYSSQHQTSCWNMSTSCQLNGLQCGTTYDLTVLAEDNTCNSTGSSQAVLMTAPCSPYVENSTQICGTNSSSVSWMSMADATGYILYATAIGGHSVSCSSVTPSCELTDLVCGETYTATIVAQGSQCDSPPGQSTDITTVPCPPAVVSKQYMCDNNTVMLSWSNTVGSLSYQAEIVGYGYMDSCNTTNTSCVVHELPCGLDLNVTVQAEGEHCNSAPSVCQSLQTAPCAPVNISATLVCFNHSALVSWSGSYSAVEYTVTSSGQDGHTHQCHSNTTSCQLSHIHCGETYDITVTPHSESCAGTPSEVYSFSAGLCSPSNVTMSPPCEDNNIVSWSSVTGAEMYIATAIADDGQTHNCSSNTSTSCQFTDLQCGQNYSVTVVTVDRGCRSEPSSAVQVTTALCPPTNLMGQVACDTNAVTISWDQSAVPGVSYILKYEKLYGTPTSSSLTISTTSHTFTDLQCGQQYAFYIAFQDGVCSSSYSPSMELITAPCQPTNFTAHVDCGMNKGNFSWAESNGADFYTVEVIGDHGHVASCASNDTSCAVTLHCGRTYSASLVASTESCNSTEHADIYFDSAPCLPEDVVAVMDCYTNVMNVSWSETPGSDNYTAWAISTHGHRASCNSTYNNCSIHDLHCGHVYEVVVTSSSVQCEIIAGSDYQVQAAPCKPENVTGDLNCSSNIMTVMWDQVSSLAQNFTVEATSASGVNSTCETNMGYCSFLDLSCGQLYTFTVMGYTNVCMSEMSYPTAKQTAPCPPGEVSAVINCTTRKALVSWNTADAATAFSVLATTTDGHNSSCSEMGTSCELNNLVCGQNYSVIVDSMHTGCAGPATTPVLLTTDPCVPINISVYYRVVDTQVLWIAADGASSYTVWAGNDQGTVATCNSTGTSCYLSGLQCGQIYNVTLTAHNQACDSLTSDTQYLKTEPCPPTNVLADVECDQLEVTIFWDQSTLAVGYVAYVYDHYGGYKLMCEVDDTNTSCEVSGLMCGTPYDVWVVALGEEYNSSNSTTITFSSEPCPPESIEAVMDCEIKSAIVSWVPGIGAVSYMAELTASSGHTASCTTNQTNCLLTSLQCGEGYIVTVTSVGDACNSTDVMSGFLITESCVPMNLSVHFNVSQAHVTWGETKGAGSYCVQAVTDQGLTATCNTTNTQCTLTDLQCSQIYNVTVSAKNDVCNNTAKSETYRLMTEPCPPTNVQANVECEQLTMTVSWEQSELAVGYVAYVYDHYGYYLTCEAEDIDTSCAVSGLMCGTLYYVWAIALGEQYNSSYSTMVMVTSAPCLPTNVDVEVDCNSDGVAVASWSPPYGIANISLTASGSRQFHCQAGLLSICNLTGLDCGETYNLSLTASNNNCNVTSHMQSNFTTRPCQPRYVGVVRPCGTEAAVLSWEMKPEVELYMASAVSSSGGDEHWCNSTGSSCAFPSLSCGEMYNFTVKALSHGCCSQVSDSVYVQTDPCQPVIVLAQSPCQSEVLQLSWNHAGGVLFYLITATGNLGYVENYNTTQISLTASLPCGQNYSVTVQGQGSECNSDPSTIAFVKTSPCIPRDVRIHEQCGANAATVVWGSSEGAKTYAAEAIGLDGYSYWCYSNQTNCTWDDLRCGEVYMVSVMAKDEDCTSFPSNSSFIYMEPCPPQNVLASVDCDLNAASLSWDASNGATVYVISLEMDGYQSVSQNTNDTQVYLSNLNCGANYNLTVTPYNDNCEGMTSAMTPIQTWPCPPGEVYAMQDCFSDTVMVMWQPGNGTNHYTATMDSDIGNSQICMSYSGECNVSGLTCGQNFSVSVTASNQQCNVTSVANHSVHSVPCSPTDVSVAKDCASNAATVSWSASDGATQYLVTASCYHGNVSHQTSDLNYTLDDLMCGNRYSVQVVAMDDNCSSVPSQVLVFDAAPCPPQNVSTQLSCMSNNLTVSWDSDGYADYYLVAVYEDNIQGSNETFNTTSNECSTSPLNCGSSYTIQITAVKGDCQIRSTQNYSTLSAPCQPQGIQGSLDCVTNSAWMSWDSTLGADSYTVLAIGEDASTANCTTWTNTSCEVEDLACGILYNFSVIAKNSQCDSYPSTSIELETAPCSLSGITAFTECHDGSILVLWELVEGSEGNTVYTATAEASDYTYLYCNSTGTNCTLQGAQCDLYYTIIIAASSDSCSSLRSPPYRISMEPCPPREVNVSASCEDHSALVSWTRSPVAATYQVVAMSADGHTHTCSDSSTNCTLTELHCDEQYAVHVTASHQNCTSMASHNVTFNTGPCQPEDLSVTFHCSNQSAVLSWTPSDNAVDYYGCAQAPSGEMLYCYNTYPTCTIPNLDCGTLYNFSVQASDGTCNSSFSEPVEKGAVPCPPDGVEVQPFMMYMEIQTLRFTWTEISCADTEYLLRLSGTLLGNSQAQFEVSSYWTNMTSFEIPLPCGSSYSATVESRNTAGTGDQSVPLNDTTAPCQPTMVMYSSNITVARVSWSPSMFATTYFVYKHNISLSSRLCTTTGLSCFLLINIDYSDLLVTASNAAGESQGSTVTSVVAHVRKRDVSESEGLSAPVLNVTLLTSVMVMAEWPQEDASNDAAYRLMIKPQAQSESPQELTVLGSRYILTGLSPNSTYCLTVAARRETDVGPESDPVCLETGQAS
ncbi:pneumococcal serine-rich repeat protein [Syngnathus scovelli]|uniref:pneumococcal serine-rich repeat protein n=1 Tax=Syngnathus scovelli TaxID=161590 RepID=UPI002110B1FE|nr:uncharacterized protein fndc7rs1 [Syngnathus scovelli]